MKWFQTKQAVVVTLLLMICCIIATASTIGEWYEDEDCIARGDKVWAFNETLTPAQKAAYWQAHFQNVLNTMQLTGEQEEVIRQMQAVDMEAEYAYDYDDPNAVGAENRHADLLTAIDANFSAAEKKTIFFDLPEYNPGTLTPEQQLVSRPMCNCRGFDCNILSSCYEQQNLCYRTRRGCGPAWWFECFGRCMRYLE